MNLLCSDQEGAEAALHFNPRLDESVVVFNTKEGGTWGKEERGRGLPFQRGQPFDLLLITVPEGFKVCLCHRGGHQDPGPSCGWERPARPLVEVGGIGVAKAGRVLRPSGSHGATPGVSDGQVCAGHEQREQRCPECGCRIGDAWPRLPHQTPLPVHLRMRSGLRDRNKDGLGDRAQEQVPEGVGAADPPPPSGRGRQRTPGSC